MLELLSNIKQFWGGVMERIDEVFEFYNNGAEIGRLERGLGIVEFDRSKEIIARYLKDELVIYDIGGGIGKYSEWLASLGHKVSLIELAPVAVEYAKEHMTVPYEAVTGDARKIEKPDSSADMVLLMGPLYHLNSREDRMLVLSEARRVLKDGGILITAGISKFSSATWALTVYGSVNDFIDDDIYMDMIRREMKTGEHIRPKEYPYFISNAYFHTIDGLRNEISEAGFTVKESAAVEGCSWITPDIAGKWNDPAKRERLLEIIRITEHEETMMGISPHFIVCASK